VDDSDRQVHNMDLEEETVIKARTKCNIGNAVEKDIFKTIGLNEPGTITG